MIKEEKNEEMSRQFETIYRENQDPEIQAKKRAKLKKELEQKTKEEDLGL